MAAGIALNVLDSLCEVIVKEAELFRGVEDQVMTLGDHLKLMGSFLRVAERADQEHVAAKELVIQIRDFAYEAEDIIDKYLVVVRQSASGFDRWNSKFQKLFNKHDLGRKIEAIRKQIEEIYANKQLSGIEDTTQADFCESSLDGTPSPKPRKAPYVADNADVVGFHNEIETLVRRLNEGEQWLAVIPIVGVGGLGKTTLAKKVYNLVKNKFRCHAWVSFSQDCTPMNVLQQIVKSFTGSIEEKELGKKLSDCLKDKKYLLVLDDIWRSDFWLDLAPYFPEDNNGSRIMFTTRLNDVALQTNPNHINPPYSLSFRNHEDSWEIFHKKAFGGESCTSEWEDLGRKFAEKCGGLPLAIIILGGLLSAKQRTFSVWQNVLDNASTTLVELQNQCLGILALSYNDLPYHLKPCFLYIGVFPSDFEIHSKQLIRLWIAEGLIKAEGNQTMEATAENYLYMLVDRSLIQVVRTRADGGVKTLKFHDLLREYCISKGQKERFFNIIKNVDSEPVSPSTKIRRVVTNSEIFRYMNHGSGHCALKKVRSLLSFTKDPHRHLIDRDHFLNIKSLTLLRVLNLDGASVDNLPDDIDKLVHLRYLRLGTSALKSLPLSIFKLSSLETLNIGSALIRNIPVGFWMLRHLRHANFVGDPELLLPRQDTSYSSLVNLQTLSTVSPKILQCLDFVDMPNLTKLGLCGDLWAHRRYIVRLFNLERLEKLKLVRLTDYRFGLYSIPKILPDTLTKLTLCDTELVKDPMPTLGKLQNLQILKLLRQSCTTKVIVCGPNGFPRLQVLQLVSLPIEEWTVDATALKSLEHLVIHYCPRLREFPKVLWVVKSLQVVDLLKPGQQFKEGVESYEGRHQYKIIIGS